MERAGKEPRDEQQRARCGQSRQQVGGVPARRARIRNGQRRTAHERDHDESAATAR